MVLGTKHRDYVTFLNNLAGLYHSQGDYTKAFSLLKETLHLYRGIKEEFILSTSEAEALNYLRTFPLTHDAFLSLTRDRSSTEQVYSVLQDDRFLITQIIQRRNLALLSQHDPKLGRV